MDCIAFEPKAYNEEDNILADSSFGFKVSEQSYNLIPYDLMEMYYKDKDKVHHTASFYNTKSIDSDDTRDYSIDFIKCDDDKLFQYLISTEMLYVPDIYKNHQCDRQSSIESIIEGINNNLPLYGMPYYWDNGLISKKRD